MLHLTWVMGIAACAGAAMFAVHLRRSRNVLWPFVLLFCFFLGMGRASFTVCSYQRMWDDLGTLDKTPVLVKGQVRSLNEKEGTTELTLKNCSINKINSIEEKNGVENGGSIGAFGDILVRFRTQEGFGTALETPEQTVRIGETVSVTGYLKMISPAKNPGEFDYRNYYASLGIGIRMDAGGITRLHGGYGRLPDSLYRLRTGAAELLERISKPEDTGIFLAAVLGDKSQLDGQVKALYQRNGIAHLLAISGLHLSIVGMGIYRLMRKTGLGFGTAGILGACFIGAYGMMTGGAASVVRAAFMMMAGFMAAYLGRTYDLLSAMAPAAVFLLWKSPYLLVQGGFQLSFGAVGAIGLAVPVIRRWLPVIEKAPFLNGIRDGFIISLSVQMVTFPVILYHFYQIPPYGILLNLVVIPLMGVVVCSGIAGIVLAVGSTGVGMAALGPGHYVLALYGALCTFTSGLPAGNVIMGRPSLERIALYYAMLSGVLAYMNRWMHILEKKKLKEEQEEKAQINNRQPGKQGMEAGGRCFKPGRAFALAAVCILGFFSLFPFPVSGMRVLWMDVGQGDGCLIRTGNHAILIDGGSSSHKTLGQASLEPCLKSYGVSSIDYIFVSHGDMDHISGLLYLLEEGLDIRISRICVPWLGSQNEGIIKLKELAEKRGIPVTEIAAQDRFVIGEVAITCLYPGKEDDADNANQESTLLKVDYGNCHMLFTGDMDSEGERRVLERFNSGKENGNNDSSPFLKEIQILKTAHHGSRFSTCDPWLDSLSLRYAVISYQKGNSYGHPHEDVIKRMEKHRIKLWRTAESGGIELSTDGKRIRWKPFLRY